jgi:polyhydroxyalkanoate synthesis regulator phasin
MRFLLTMSGVVLLFGATLGLTYAQGVTPKQSIIEDAAARLGVSSTDLAQALKDARKELGDKRGVQIRQVVKSELDVAAKAVGLADAKALRAELRGSTLTAVAQKHNVAPATVATAIKNDINTRIDALVSSGKLKADRAATLKQRAAERVDALMTREFKARS